MRCSACNGVYHESTGHRFGDVVVLCGPCARDFVDWLKKREASMGARLKDKKTGRRSALSFLDAAIRSIIGD